MSRVPPAAVGRLAMLAAVPPVVVLCWMVAAPAAQLARPVALVAGAIAVAGWGVRAGVHATDRRGGLLRRGGARVGRIVGIVVAGAAVSWSSTGTVPDWPGAVPQLGVPVALLFAVFFVARGIGRVYRMQADPSGSGVAHRDADAALPMMVLTGVAVAVGTQTAVLLLGGTGWAVRPWVPMLWVGMCAAAIAAVRPAVLRARTAVADVPFGGRWLHALVPLVVAVGALTPLVAWVLGSAAPRLQIDLPDLSWLVDGAPQQDLRPPAPVNGEPPLAGAAWLLAALAVVALALLLTSTRPARRRVLRPRGQKMPLSQLLRALLGVLFGSQRTVVVAGADGELTDATSIHDEVTPRGQLTTWMWRLRPRPRDPTAAILHDYAAVQRHLPAERRRRASETALVHAEREDDDALGELAALVCAVRYAGVRPTSVDARRSRTLARQVMRR